MKTSVDDLALFGGPPEFAAPLHVGRPNIGDRDAILERLERALDSRVLSNGGPLVREFEGRVAAAAGTRYCVATSSGTTALQIALRAAGLRGEVVMPALTFPATAHAAEWEGLTPVFADVEPGSYCVDPEAVAKLLTPDTAAILGVHLWGRACDVPALEQLAERTGLVLLFDAAHALGCAAGGRPLAAYGRAATLSFHATKVCNSFEGGAIVTDDADLADRAALLRNFGFQGEDLVVSVGTNGKMSEAAAAMGLASLEALPSFIEHNRANYHRYREELAGLDGVSIMPFDPPESSNCHHVAIEVAEDEAGLSRDQLHQVLVAENVLVRRYFYPGCHRMEPYRSRAGGPPSLPVTDGLLGRVLSLPTGTAVSPESVGAVCALIEFVVSNSDEIVNRLGASFTSVART